jgi:hypothetical protein
MKKHLTPPLFLFFTLCACVHEPVALSPGSDSIEQPGVMAMRAEFLKDKGKKFDLKLVMTNLSPATEIIWLKDIRCARGNVPGELTMINARHGDVPITWRAGEVKALVFTCDYGHEMRGNFTLFISKISDNPSGDGRTVGKPLSSGLKFEQVDNGRRY